MLYITMMNDNAVAQMHQNRLESIASQADKLTSAQIDVGDSPSFIDSSPYILTNNIYVANFDSGTISVIDLTSNTVVKNINVGDSPASIDIPPLGDNIYVANSGSDTISVIDSTMNTVVKNIPVGDSPFFIESFEYPQYGFTDIYVANRDSNTISVINSTTNTVVKNITVGYAPDFIYASPLGHIVYVVNGGSNTISVINSTTNTVVKNIKVGDIPMSIDAYEETIYDEDNAFVDTIYGYVYVANWDSGISVIDPITYTVVKNITVGDNPQSINTRGDNIYVANRGSNTISVINSTTNTVVKNITVGDDPLFIGSYGKIYADPLYGDNIYVANHGSNTISVINSTTNTVVKNITVGDSPTFIHAPSLEETVYVANTGSGTISVIDSTTNEVVAGVTFNINPFSGGQIICNGLKAPINRYYYVASGTGCLAKPNNGFEFSSWTQNLPQNSSNLINASTTSGSPWTSFLEIFGIKSNDPAATLTVNKFGSFTAYFKALPPPVPAEYIASLFTVVVTAIVGSLFIPSAISWFKSKKQTSRLNSFHQQMALVYADGRLDENDIDKLNTINNNISDYYAAGKITNDQYMHLKNEVSTAFQEIFKKRIESVTDPITEAFSRIKRDIKDAYATGKIIELHYNLLNEQISDILSNK